MKHFYLIFVALMLTIGVKAFLTLHPSALTELSKIERFGLRHHKFTDLKNELLMSGTKAHKAKLVKLVKNGKKKEFDSEKKHLNIYKEFLIGQLKTKFFKDFHTRRY